jgi:ferritin-like metal-binding protein YciE
MAEVEDVRALLVMAVQDLGDAEAAMVERLAAVRVNARDAELQDIIAADETLSADQQQVLAAIARELGAEPKGTRNIWLRAVLDDADNDAKTIAPGPLLDVALAGALRKGKQSERVSYETAVRLAERLDMDEAARALAAIRDAEAETDAALAEAQKRLCAGLP